MIIFASIGLKTLIFKILMFLIAAFGISFAVCVILHETGHLVAGLIAGYRFSSLELFGLRLVKKKSGFTITLAERPCMGQCIMDPPGFGKNAGFLILGGVFANILTALICAVWFFKMLNDATVAWFIAGLKESTGVWDMFSLIFSFVSAAVNLSAAVTNIWPFGRINDGNTYMDIKKSSMHNEAYNRLMRVYSLLNEGKKPEEADEELFDITDLYFSSLSAELSVFRYLRASAMGTEYAEAEMKKLEKYPMKLLSDFKEVYKVGFSGKDNRYNCRIDHHDDPASGLVTGNARQNDNEICPKLRE